MTTQEFAVNPAEGYDPEDDEDDENDADAEDDHE